MVAVKVVGETANFTETNKHREKWVGTRCILQRHTPMTYLLQLGPTSE
jgi:hypothetical protein